MVYVMFSNDEKNLGLISMFLHKMNDEPSETRRIAAYRLHRFIVTKSLLSVSENSTYVCSFVSVPATPKVKGTDISRATAIVIMKHQSRFLHFTTHV